MHGNIEHVHVHVYIHVPVYVFYIYSMYSIEIRSSLYIHAWLYDIHCKIINLAITGKLKLDL